MPVGPRRARLVLRNWTGGLISLALIAFAAPDLPAQTPPPTPPPTTMQNPARGGDPATPPPGGQRGGGRGRGAVQVLSLTTTAWTDGGTIPLKHTQPGDELSPPLTWSDPPENIASFVLIVHDVDAAVGDGLSDTLHWLVWNIPAPSRALPEGVPQGATRPDGSRQISATGPYYRGPAAPATGPAHHYLFELYALDTTLDVAAVGASPADTRAAVLTAMAGHVRAKGALIGLFKRN